jgi:hypothetical protein
MLGVVLKCVDLKNVCLKSGKGKTGTSYEDLLTLVFMLERKRAFCEVQIKAKEKLTI